MMSSTKSLALSGLITLAAMTCAFLLQDGVNKGWFVPWKSLGRPPEKAIELLITGHNLSVVTASGQVYRAVSGPGCEITCWTLLDKPELELAEEPQVPCGWHPTLLNAIDTRLDCYLWGPGAVYVTEYAIRSDGTVLFWGHGEGGEGGPLLWNSMAALCYGLPAGLLMAVCVAYFTRAGRVAKSKPTDDPS